ncbi:MAG: ribosomal protein [Pseudomonadota bacterium]|jgi:large subunit ribosomal protein L13
MKTYSLKKQDISPEWLLVDAAGCTLGRLASQIAFRLKGKHKPTYATHLDNGDYVVVVNADKIAVTGKNKSKDKMYHHYSGYPGGLKTTSLEKLLQRFPERVIQKAIKGMLPKGPLGREMFSKLKVYAGSEHPHEAQQPKPVQLLNAVGE